MGRSIKRRLYQSTIILLFVVTITSCGARYIPVSQTGIELGTYVKITLIVRKDGQKKALEAIDNSFLLIRKLDGIFDYRIEGGALADFNDGTRLSKSDNGTLFGIISDAMAIADKTGGFFDPTVLPLMLEWGFDTDSPHLPSPEGIQRALEHVGYERVSIFETYAEKPVEVKLDLGGIAKGRIVDLVRYGLADLGYEDFLIDAGGDIYVSGKNAHRKKWRIAIQDPVRESEIRGIVQKSDTAIVTSGDYERFFTVDGVRYSHLFNPMTGYPESNLKSVTVLHEDTAYADAIATAVFVMGSVKGYEFLKRNGIEGYLIFTEDDGSIEAMSTPGFWD
ncbi:MAG: FAD:protein FMN transferase [Spirochaetes bacterium]|nr:FAD:protein FMN transferase [Spirochaetota bacterium]